MWWEWKYSSHYYSTDNLKFKLSRNLVIYNIKYFKIIKYIQNLNKITKQNSGSLLGYGLFKI